MFMNPSGTLTSDSKVYAKAWKDLAEGVLWLMPDWKLTAFDPHLTFERGDGGVARVDRKMAEALVKLKEAK